MDNTIIPFGILFEERSTMYSQEVVTPEYDPVEGISYIIDSVGKCVPYVNWAWETFGTQTGLLTETYNDPTDTDPGDDSPYYLSGTQTITRVKGETTDTD